MTLIKLGREGTVKIKAEHGEKMKKHCISLLIQIWFCKSIWSVQINNNIRNEFYSQNYF